MIIPRLSFLTVNPGIALQDYFTSENAPHTKLNTLSSSLTKLLGRYLIDVIILQ